MKKYSVASAYDVFQNRYADAMTNLSINHMYREANRCADAMTNFFSAMQKLFP